LKSTQVNWLNPHYRSWEIDSPIKSKYIKIYEAQFPADPMFNDEIKKIYIYIYIILKNREKRTDSNGLSHWTCNMDHENG